MKRLLYLPLFLVPLACGSSAPEPLPAANPAKAELSAKLRAMPKEERAKYLKQHPEELAAALPELGGPAKQRSK